MKQGTIKNLGVAALGAAFAVTAAGTAAAAPAAPALPAADAIDTAGVLHGLPVEQAAKAVSKSTDAKPVGGVIKTKAKPNAKGNLLGGLPVGKNLPAGAVAKGLPLGG
ncbi:hypothetical protein [Streptomyces sp. NPDC017993]|uniref:hypothetical protein n=1 Tax=Streptomyces sp. NPDC017993 TaxID=3365027 RepID=UPI003791F3B7